MYDYQHQFALHVIDWHLWLAAIPIRRFAEASTSLRISPADWSRSS